MGYALRKSSRRTAQGHVTRGDIFDDLGFSPKKAAAVKLKAELHRKIMSRAEQYSQRQLKSLLSETQSRISQLLRGKISGFTLEMLIYYADRLGIHTQIRTTETRKPPAVAWEPLEKQSVPAYQIAASRIPVKR